MRPLDLGYVQPAQHQEQLAGIGQIAEDYRAKKKTQAGQKALGEAWASQDPQAIAQVAIDYPDLAPKVKELSNMHRFMQEDSLRNNAILAMKAKNITDVTDRDTMLTLAKDELQDAGDPRWQDVNEVIGLPPEEQDAMLDQVINMATRFGAIEPEAAALGRSGKYSAKTIIFNDGSQQTVNPDTGRSEVRNPLGDIVEGEDRLITLQKGRDSGVSYSHDTAYAAAAGKGKGELEYRPQVESAVERATSAVKAANKLVPEMQKVRRNIANYGDAITAIDQGAETGVIDSKLVSITDAATTLDNIRNRLGLDIIGAVTFGALSQGELDLALDTALPTNKDPKHLRKWVVDRKEAQEKLLAEMEKANLLMQKGYSPSETYARMHSIPPNRTNADVTANMNKYGWTREQVLEKMWDMHQMRK